MEALHPRLSGYAMPEGTMASLGADSAATSAGVQVGPVDLNPGRGILHNYRPEGVNLVFTSDAPAATSTALANPQFGGGGLRQHFVPDIGARIAAGDISVVDPAGNVLDVRNGFVSLANGQAISLHNLDLAAGSPILTQQDVAATIAGTRYVASTVGEGTGSVAVLAARVTETDR